MKVKSWFIRREDEKARVYHCMIDIDSRDERGTICEDENGYFDVRGKVLKETEKAAYVLLSTGDFDGSVMGWKTWIPKSLMA